MRKVPYKTNQNDPYIQAYIEAVEKGKQNLHVVIRGNSWIVSGLEKQSKTFNNQEDAINYAKSTAIAGTAVFIHGSDGRIREIQDIPAV